MIDHRQVTDYRGRVALVHEMNELDTPPDAYDAFDIIDELAMGLDFVVNATKMKWCAYFTQAAYDIIKSDPGGYLYKRDEEEYVIIYDNVPHFVIHMRVTGIDPSLVDFDPLGCRCEIDG